MIQWGSSNKHSNEKTLHVRCSPMSRWSLNSLRVTSKVSWSSRSGAFFPSLFQQIWRWKLDFGILPGNQIEGLNTCYISLCCCCCWRWPLFDEVESPSLGARCLARCKGRQRREHVLWRSGSWNDSVHVFLSSSRQVAWGSSSQKMFC